MPASASRLLAVHLPRFLIQRRLREDGSLAHRPVAVVRAGAGGESLVCASRRALVAGAAPGMSAAAAKALCPALRLLPDDPAADLRALEGLAEALLAVCPAVELCGPEGLWLDPSSAPLFGGEPGLLAVVDERVRALGYRANALLAEGKFSAMALAVHRPRPARVQGPAAAALAPLPLSALPASDAVRWALEAMGLKSLGALAALPAAGVAARFGAEGTLLHRLASGEDPRPLVPYRPAPPLVEALGLEESAESLEPVLFALKTALDRLTARLAGRGMALVRLEVRLRLDPEGERRLELPLARPTSSSRLLLELLRTRLSDLKVDRPVAGVGVEALETGPAERVQLCVGDRPQVDEALESTLSRLRSGLGEEALFAAEPLARHRPEGAWRPRPYRPTDAPARAAGSRPPRQKRAFLSRLLAGAELAPSPCPAGGAPLAQDPLLRPGARPTRLLERPAPLEVELGASGRLVAVRIGSRRHVAAAVRGPERLGGEWWRAGYARDYYRALVAGVGGCWIYRDGRDGRFYLHGYFD